MSADMSIPTSTAPVEAPEAGTDRPVSRGRLVVRRLLRSKTGLAGAAFIVLLFVGAFLSPFLYPWDYRTQDDYALLMPPSPEHWFGTTKLGEDLFAQCMRG